MNTGKLSEVIKLKNELKHIRSKEQYIIGLIGKASVEFFNENPDEQGYSESSVPSVFVFNHDGIPYLIQTTDDFEEEKSEWIKIKAVTVIPTV